MYNVIVSLGSNTLPAAHIQWACERLLATYGDVHFTRKLWTTDIKGNGIWYINRLATFRTSLPLADLEAELKAIEGETGRNTHQVTLDIDVMQYGDQRYHLKDWPRPYIQHLLPDIEP